MKPLSILHLAANRWWTGSADPIIHLVSGLRARGHRVLLGLIPGDRFETKAKEAGLDLVEGLRMDGRLGPRALARDVLRLRALIRDEGVDLTRFTADADPTPIRTEFKLGDAPVVVSVARLATNRGHELLLSGFRLLVRRLPRARLLLVGKGETRSRLEKLVADLELGSHVVFTGYRDADLPSVLAAADCFALMAAGSDESCRAALEAMAAGRPVIARRVGALPETVMHGETGILIDDDQAESVARALETILEDPARRRAMGRAGRATAEERFGAERSVETVERVYQDLR